ncbi:putative MFS family arabinose efflux permease [Paraburkholderia sp. GV068]|uniref:MFS transporter n=1 Tax=Paraburkholderia TaxID=1822464 RepID=UPI000D301F3F|nr:MULTISPECIES: MFS transporter [unclassified Paraburkholderia]PTQ99120.1 putative MFS family arabinose efflux permease [Paraburkholderia sp. GV072]PUB04612.1 putative MFS family arabinose efflux permease [Paraburkholderia sp. GV068]
MLDDSRPDRIRPVTVRHRWTVLVASTGGALEVFDFVIYGFFAQNIGAEFFPRQMGVSGQTLSFTVLAAGYLSRPLGGIVLGHFGDKYGRRIVFISSAMIAAVSTLLIGMLPSYAVWGATASVLLLALRLVQGLCLGGELPGAVIYAVETARGRPGFICGIVFVAVNLALLLATTVNMVVQSMLATDRISASGWRIGFLIGGMVGLLSFALRRTLAETDEYAQAIGARHREPLAVLFRSHLRPVAAGVAACSLVGASSGMFIGFMPSYLQGLHYEAREIGSAQILYLIAVAACILITSYVGDLLPRYYVFRAGTVLSALLTPIFFIAAARYHVNLTAWFILAGTVTSLANGVYACAIAEMFPVDVRFSGLATAMNLGLAASLGLTPLAAHIAASNAHWNPGLPLVACAAFAFAASFGMRRVPRRGDSDEASRRSRREERA